MNKGIDASTYFDTLAHGGKFFDGGLQIDPLDAFARSGVDRMRIRVWNDPRDENGASYNAGGCDTENFLRLGKLAQSKGFKVSLDMHYSDFWADPKKQEPPKAWKNFSLAQVKRAMRDFTLKTLLAAKESGLDLEMIQVGNEITNGMLWPFGKIEGDSSRGESRDYGALADLLKVGISACREIFPRAQIVLHLEQSGQKALYAQWFSHMRSAGVDYDAIGMSYYPFWHGPLEALWENVDECARSFGKKIVIAEWSYAFSLEGYALPGGKSARMSAGENSPVPLLLPFPPTPRGQADFTRAFLRGAREHGVECVFYWEPLWLPCGGETRWASEAGLEYIGESGKSTENEWANQCLFDYDGAALPAFKTYCEE